MTRALTILAGSLACGLLASCTIDRTPTATVVLSPSVPAAESGAESAPAQPADVIAFAPRSLRVHPLTHVDIQDPGGDGLLILHVELRDRFGDSVKGIGQLSVDLSSGEPGTGFAQGSETRVRWDVPDIADPETSSRRFDPATRTYRIPLKSPAWVSRWLSDENERRGGPESLTLRVTFTPTAGEDRRVLTDEYQIEP
ncbi:MAG TPA: hypothetical protein VHN77_02150 [Phycisphaerales bacterium]|nr:hypothetical protein [Phycisphaerales bacterium]